MTHPLSLATQLPIIDIMSTRAMYLKAAWIVALEVVTKYVSLVCDVISKVWTSQKPLLGAGSDPGAVGLLFVYTLYA